MKHSSILFILVLIAASLIALLFIVASRTAEISEQELISEGSEPEEGPDSILESPTQQTDDQILEDYPDDLDAALEEFDLVS